MKRKKDGLTDIPLEIKAEETLVKAVGKAIVDHRRAGHPIVIWRDGKVVKNPAEQIEIREPGAEHRILGKKGQ